MRGCVAAWLRGFRIDERPPDERDLGREGMHDCYERTKTCGKMYIQKKSSENRPLYYLQMVGGRQGIEKLKVWTMQVNGEQIRGE